MRYYKNYKLTLTALTPIVLTQRESQQLISGVDFEIEKNKVKWLSETKRGNELGSIKDIDKITTIYSAYFNGESYYIPGTTIKGNIMKRTTSKLNPLSFMVSDFLISTKSIKIENVKKVTQLKSNCDNEKENISRKIKFFEQFQQIGYEVIQKDTKCYSYIKIEEGSIDKILESIKDEGKLKKWKETYRRYLNDKYIGDIDKKESKESLKKILNNTEEIISKKDKDAYIISIGGLRGFYNAFEKDEMMPGIYFQTINEGKEEKEVILGFASLRLKEV